MITGSVLGQGIARTIDGAVYTNALATTAAVPPTATQIKGNGLPFGKAVDSDGALYVRFV